MRVYRITRAPYAAKGGAHLGSMNAAGRWHEVGRAVVYAARLASTCAMEYLVNAGTQVPRDLVLVGIELPDDAPVVSIESRAVMPDNWRNDEVWSRAQGVAFLDAGDALALDVPSVIVPEDRNLILNPAHPAYVQVRFAVLRRFTYDPRLLEGRSQ